MEQVASGVNTVNNIAQKIGENLSTVLYSLEKLIRIDLVQKKKCITEEKNRKKVQYVLKDHMFTFCYSFHPNATSIIEMGQGDLYYDKIFREYLHAYMGSVFEDMCRYYTLEQGIQGAFGNFITHVGTWWGTETLDSASGKYQQSADIDVVGISDIDKTVVLGECKFKNKKTDKGVYDIFLRRSASISAKYHIIKYLFFSLGGYTEWIQSVNNDAVVLLTLDDLYQQNE
ncbi:MAG: DUF234 domain-containing protein [Lachnospiraceae bacterium]|nr:DUF234 domain-containing protein [Lachnospiraceae bacterium]